MCKKTPEKKSQGTGGRSSGLKSQHSSSARPISGLLSSLPQPLAGAEADSDSDSEYDDESDAESLKAFNDEFAKFFKKYPNEAIEAKISQEQGMTYAGK